MGRRGAVAWVAAVGLVAGSGVGLASSGVAGLVAGSASGVASLPVSADAAQAYADPSAAPDAPAGAEAPAGADAAQAYAGPEASAPAPAPVTLESRKVAENAAQAQAPVSRSARCYSAVAGLGPKTARKIPANTRQVVVTVGKAPRSSYSTVQFWQKLGDCWNRQRRVPARNGYSGWHPRPWDGSGYSPIGVYGLTDAGGRLPNPGTKLPYHYGPQTYARGGYKMNNQRVQVFDYVVAMNFNRYVGRPPRDEGRPNKSIPDGGIWFHVAGAGATRGCVSVSKAEMARALRWLRPGMHPVMVMGPARRLAR